MLWNLKYNETELNEPECFIKMKISTDNKFRLSYRNSECGSELVVKF